MNVPLAEIIEGAALDLENLKRNSGKSWVVTKQGGELCEALGGKVDQMTCLDGYNLGLQVARRMIASSVEIKAKGVEPEDVL